MPRQSINRLAIESAINADRWIKSESEMQVATARLLDSLGLPWFHPANERKCTPRQGGLLKRCGVKSGVPDVLIFQSWQKETTKNEWTNVDQYSGCAIELKYGKNKPTANQLEWLHQLSKAGWYTDIAYSMADVVAILEKCGYINLLEMKGE